MSELPFAVAPVMGLLAATPVAGFALANGTPNILSWTAPNDGQAHRVLIFSSQHVTSLETGGQVTSTYAAPDGGAGTVTLYGGGSGAGVQTSGYSAVVQPGSTVVVKQATALTAGAALVWAELWGS